MRIRSWVQAGLAQGSEGEMEAGRGVLEERQIRNDEAVARAAEEDPDGRQDQPERTEQSEQDDGGPQLGRPGRGQIAAIDGREEAGADEDEEGRQHSGYG